MPIYDYLIVGSGLFGATFAYEATKRGKKCYVIERRNHIGGNVYTKKVKDIEVHMYGAHIFRTSDDTIWEYVHQFSPFNNFINTPIANYKGKLYNLPFNMNTFCQMWNITTPQEAQSIINKQKGQLNKEPQNLEEQAISLVGTDIYEKFIKGYTEKQWGRPCTELPASILRRIPVRYTFDNNYFNARYQGIPEQGYTFIIEQMLSGAIVELNVDFNKNKEELTSIAHKIIYTGPIDEYFDYCYGPLEYRSLRFETQILDCDNYQGVAVMNFTDRETPYTRIIEHKHFVFGTQAKTVITREYPLEWNPQVEPYYPINDDKNQALYAKYKALASKMTNIIFGGRLGEYRYYDMQDTIISALALVNREFCNP